MLSRKLVTLKKDAPTKDNPNSFILKEIDTEKLYEFLREMEFNRLLSQAISFYGNDENNNSDFKKIDDKKSKINTKNYKSILVEKDLDTLVETLNKKSVISIDTETSSLNTMDAELVGISLCHELNEAYYIPLGHKKIKNLNKEIEVLNKIKNILEDPSIKKVGQNIKYDYIILKNNGIDIGPLEDTMLLSYTLDAGNNRHNMDTLSEIHLGHKTISFKELVGSGKKQINFSETKLEEATQYAAEDADVTFRLYNILYQRVNNEELSKIYEILKNQ